MTYPLGALTYGRPVYGDGIRFLFEDVYTDYEVTFDVNIDVARYYETYIDNVIYARHTSSTSSKEISRGLVVYPVNASTTNVVNSLTHFWPGQINTSTQAFITKYGSIEISLAIYINGYDVGRLWQRTNCYVSGIPLDALAAEPSFQPTAAYRSLSVVRYAGGQFGGPLHINWRRDKFASFNVGKLAFINTESSLGLITQFAFINANNHFTQATRYAYINTTKTTVNASSLMYTHASQPSTVAQAAYLHAAKFTGNFKFCFVFNEHNATKLDTNSKSYIDGHNTSLDTTNLYVNGAIITTITNSQIVFVMANTSRDTNAAYIRGLKIATNIQRSYVFGLGVYIALAAYIQANKNITALKRSYIEGLAITSLGNVTDNNGMFIWGLKNVNTSELIARADIVNYNGAITDHNAGYITA